MFTGYKHPISQSSYIYAAVATTNRATQALNADTEIKPVVLPRKMLHSHTESECPASVYRCQHVCTAQPSNPIDSDSIKYFTILNGSLSIDSSCGNVIIEENWIGY